FNILLKKATFYQMFAPLMKQNDIVSEFFSEGLYNSQHINYLIFHTGATGKPNIQKHMIQLYQEHLFHDACSDQIMIGMMTILVGLITRYYLSTVESSLTDNKRQEPDHFIDRKSTRLNSSHVSISYAVFYLKKK